jgi:hypothetical protein
MWSDPLMETNSLAPVEQHDSTLPQLSPGDLVRIVQHVVEAAVIAHEKALPREEPWLLVRERAARQKESDKL